MSNHIGMDPSSTNITFACPSCQTQLSVPASMAGVTGPCPTCQNQLTAPHPVAPAQPPAAAPPQAASVAPQQAAPVQQQAPPMQAAPPQAAPVQAAPPQAAPVQAMPPAQLPQDPPQQASVPQAQQAAPPEAMQQAVPGGPMANLSAGSPAPPAQAPQRSSSLLGAESKQEEDRPQRRSRDRRQAAPAKAKPGRGKLVAAVAALAIIGGAAFALPKIKSAISSTQIEVPETASLNADVPTKQAADSATDAKVDNTPLPLAPADGHLANNTPPRLVDDPALDPIEEDPAFADIEGILDEPKGFLESYLKAKNWTDLVGKSLQGEALRAKMAAYYKVNPYAPEKVAEITFQHKQKLPDSEQQFYLFKVITNSNKGSFPMTVEETSEGFRTDWESYVQFKDSHLQNFLTDPKVGPDGKGEIKTFNVILRRAHDFTDDVPDSDKKWCYKIDAPVDDLDGGFSFIPKFSTYGQELDTKLKWLLLYFPIVDLRWEVDANHPGSKPYVRLMKIRQFNWRGHSDEGGLEGLPEASEG